MDNAKLTMKATVTNVAPATYADWQWSLQQWIQANSPTTQGLIQRINDAPPVIDK